MRFLAEELYELSYNFLIDLSHVVILAHLLRYSASYKVGVRVSRWYTSFASTDVIRGPLLYSVPWAGCMGKIIVFSGFERELALSIMFPAWYFRMFKLHEVVIPAYCVVYLSTWWMSISVRSPRLPLRKGFSPVFVGIYVDKMINCGTEWANNACVSEVQPVSIEPLALRKMYTSTCKYSPLKEQGMLKKALQRLSDMEV